MVHRKRFIVFPPNAILYRLADKPDSSVMSDLSDLLAKSKMLTCPVSVISCPVSILPELYRNARPRSLLPELEYISRAC